MNQKLLRYLQALSHELNCRCLNVSRNIYLLENSRHRYMVIISTRNMKHIPRKALIHAERLKVMPCHIILIKPTKWSQRLKIKVTVPLAQYENWQQFHDRHTLYWR